MYDPNLLYVDPILSNFSTGWQDQQVYGMRLAPETPVNTKSGRYRVFDRSNWLYYEGDRREPGTVAGEIGARKWSEDTFETRERSLQAPVYDEERQQLNSLGGLANPAFGGDLTINPELDAARAVLRALQLRHEKIVSGMIRDSSNYDGSHVLTLSGTSKWSDYTGGTSSASDPVSNLKTAFQKIFMDTGRWPNTIAIPFDAAGVVENHPRLVDRFKTFSLMQPGAWQILMGLPDAATADLNIFMVDSKYNSADNVDATESIASFWGQDVWIGIVDPTMGQNTQTFAKTFAQIYPNGTVRPTEKWREEPRKADLVRSSWSYDVKIVAADAGFLIKNAVAAVT